MASLLIQPYNGLFVIPQPPHWTRVCICILCVKKFFFFCFCLGWRSFFFNLLIIEEHIFTRPKNTLGMCKEEEEGLSLRGGSNAEY